MLISTRIYCVINQTASETESSFDECVLAPAFICVWNQAVFGSQRVCAWVAVTRWGRSPRQRSRGAVSSRGRKAQMVEVCLHQQCKSKTPSILQMQDTYTARAHNRKSHTHNVLPTVHCNGTRNYCYSRVGTPALIGNISNNVYHHTLTHKAHTD